MGQRHDAHPNATIFNSTAWAHVFWFTPTAIIDAISKLTENGGLLALVPMMEVRSVLTRWRGVNLPFRDSVLQKLLLAFDTASGPQNLQQITVIEAGATGAAKPFNHFG